MNACERIMPLVGRVLISAIFLFSGITKLTHFSGMVPFMASKHMPMPSVMLAGALIVEILGALCLITGFQTRIAALITFLYLIPTTLMFHNFWAMQGAMHMDNQAHFLKNLAIMGGLLILAAYGPGELSIDASRATISKP
ncbi:MAG TPA: DoxX family protein [Candidatus Acidoferrales bacterium]|nr:DoxX family protein [Candidatus Acidoferrales bacterium]